MVKKTVDNQNDTDVILREGECIPRAVYMNKYGKRMSDAELGALVRKNHKKYMKKV